MVNHKKNKKFLKVTNAFNFLSKEIFFIFFMLDFVKISNKYPYERLVMKNIFFLMFFNILFSSVILANCDIKLKKQWNIHYNKLPSYQASKEIL